MAKSQKKPGCLRPIIELMACLLEKGSVESTHLLACLFACLHIVPSGAAFEGAPIHNEKRGAVDTPWHGTEFLLASRLVRTVPRLTSMPSETASASTSCCPGDFFLLVSFAPCPA